ncbi:MAG: type II secretion system protein [bacterium]|nr:type II secretion system protein [bacterium]
MILIKRKMGFTLAEVLITLAIIGVVAAISIPSVISNTQQQEFKTGLRKAVSVLNSAITMNMALDGETPYDNSNLFGYLQRHMSIIESTTDLRGKYKVAYNDGKGSSLVNAAFYTTDGMRYEFRFYNYAAGNFSLYESGVKVCIGSTIEAVTNSSNPSTSCGGCGSYGLNQNSDNTTKPPCLVIVDVNGDRKPSPKNASCKDGECANNNTYKFSDPDGKKLSDIFTIIVTDKEAIPFGIAAQKAMYQSQK